MTLINERIRYPEVRVVDEGAMPRVMATRDAVELARDRGLDLILVAPQAQPPVCRIMDYGKFKYEKSKRDKTSHKKSAAMELKMVRLHPRTGLHDRDILIRHSERFLREGHKVRVVCQFRGRENAYPELGRKQLDAIAETLAEVATIEGPINKQGRDMTMNLTPRPGIKPLPKPGEQAEAVPEGDAEVDAVIEDAEFEAVQDRILQEAAPDEGELPAETEQKNEQETGESEPQ